ncbi:MAG: DUF6708 domain-containing protein [Burkholderia contaminans]|uniref:DUF6708 domain-containing protein n=1 Tax=Burkholderia contaminans TaxID=488447 RepID=A0AAP4VL38_9BURK|nr:MULTISPECIES: hypothetical protein [Burkholderia]MCA7874786.1 hypothetical protein [Burkholderia contaminans]MDN7568379.1 hypothetical protein [Burkholderia contaminans]MDN8022081.1 hypothetical protein [Burkholderia contaminans]UXZ72348.1 hypothetical protein NUJ29_32695 [Burkholderia contaminans]UXZ80476.1 hypothetical protein NUJ30_34710 [Burkholderia contaminans]
MWDYTYKPIRLVRSTRKVHVFRHNGPGGVWSLDWDKMVFCLKKGGVNWGVLGYLPDANGQVTHAFYLGAVMPVHPKGIGPDEPLLAHWEYFRRYMEEGPASVSAPDVFLPIENRREPFLYGVYRLWQMFGPFAVLFAPVTTLAGLFRWLAMRMSRLPRWPEEVAANARCHRTMPPCSPGRMPIAVYRLRWGRWRCSHSMRCCCGCCSCRCSASIASLRTFPEMAGTQPT